MAAVSEDCRRPSGASGLWRPRSNAVLGHAAVNRSGGNRTPPYASLSVDPQWHATWTVLARRDGQLPDDQFIGMVNYHARQPWNCRLALGWILIPRFQGRGYMQEAVSAVLSHCFTTLNTHRVEAEIEPENVRSARLAQRLGFQREGLLRDRLLLATSRAPNRCTPYCAPSGVADPSFCK